MNQNGTPTADTQPVSFSLLIKPAGADCNLRCAYCFYLDRAGLYPATPTHRMSAAVLERLVTGFMATRQAQYVFGWQGGEPTLMGLEFFQAVTRLQQQHAPPGAVVANGLQTNGTLLDDAFAAHLAQFRFLVGLSLDGPAEMHDRYRLNIAGAGSHAAVLKGMDTLRRHNVEYNVLTLVSAANIDRPAEVYRYLCDLNCLFQQYIPCVEFDGQGRLLPFAVSAEAWGEFLCRLFDAWRADGAGRVSIRLFDSIMARLLHQPSGTCAMERDCRHYFLVEHNGDVYPCDFFVEPRWLLGNIMQDSWQELRHKPLYAEFGRRKAQWSPACSACEWLDVCAGDCPKHRWMHQPTAAPVRSRLCAGWRIFFKHAMPEMKRITAELAQRMQVTAPGPRQAVSGNTPCPCGSGLKFKHCCGRR
ncbi:MAG: anaerobic sulfatase maturase [Kiritimatiellia bacterium]|nr:anaerobic sulfatase maturase [Lentisphaerota bacterium]